MSSILTGYEDPDRIILLNLSDKKLFRVCQLNKYAQKLCNNVFWARRFEQKFGAMLGEGHKINYREKYKEYSSIDNNLSAILKLAIKEYHNDLAITLINKYEIPALKKLNKDKLGDYVKYQFDMVCEYDNFPIFIVYYKIGEEFNIEFQTQNVLINAAKYGSYSIVKFILETLKYTPYDPTIHDFYDQKAYATENEIIANAVKSGNLSVVRLLHDHNFIFPSLVFESAIRTRNIDMVKYLIDERVPFPTPDNNNRFKYELYVNVIVDGLVRLGRKLLNYMNDNGYQVSTIPYILTKAVSNNKENVVRWLIEIGVDVNEFDGNALKTALHINNFSIAKLLIDNGARVDYPNILYEVLDVMDEDEIFNADMSGLIFLISNGLNIFENTDTIIEHVIKSRPSIGMLNAFIDIVSHIGTEAQRTEFFDKFFAGLVNDYDEYRIIKLLNDHNIDLHEELLFEAAINIGMIKLAKFLINNGLTVFVPGIVAKIALKINYNDLVLLQRVFDAGATLTTKDIKLLSSYTLTEPLDITVLKFLIKHGFQLIDAPHLISLYENSANLDKDSITFLHNNGVKRFIYYDLK